MKLSEQLFAEIHDTLVRNHHDGSDQAVHEHRRALRIRVDMDVTLVPYGTLFGRPRSVKLRNFSASGVCILDWQVMRPDEKFVIHLPRAKDRVVPVICTVRNSRVRGNGLFFTGAEFTCHAEAERGRSPLSQSVIGLESRPVIVGVETSAPVAGDTRRDARTYVKARAPMFVQKADGSLGPQVHVDVRDVSSGGICILHTEKMATGDQFLIEVNNPGHDPLWILYTVRSCRALENSKLHRIGAAMTSIRCDKMRGGWISRLRRVFGSAGQAEAEARLQDQMRRSATMPAVND